MLALRYYMEVVNEHMEVFMIPRLINNLGESVKMQVIWVNDVVNISDYKHIDKVVFLGLHPLNKAPYLLNYAVSESNIELNFEITTVWGYLKDWVYKEKINLDAYSLNDKITGNFILQFNRRYELVYINEYDKAELDPFFKFPDQIKSTADLKLDHIIRNSNFRDVIISNITSMIMYGERESVMSNPHVHIRISLDHKQKMKSFTLIFKSSKAGEIRNSDAFADFEYAVTPISIIKNQDEGDSIPDNPLSMYSNSILSGLKRKQTPKDTKGNLKKSAFGAPNKKPDSGEKMNSPSLEKTDTLKVPLERLRKQGSRNTIECSINSDIHSANIFSLKAYNSGGNAVKYAKSKNFIPEIENGKQEDNRSRYRKIEEQMNGSIVMEYMQSSDGDGKVGCFSPEFLRLKTRLEQKDSSHS